AVRLYKAAAGINITASHNPKEYNGYKVYGPDGAQLAPELAGKVAALMADIDPVGDIPLADIDRAAAEGKIELIGEETDEIFLENVLKRSLRPGAAARSGLKVVYTPFYGAGAKLVPQALKRLGLKDLICVEEQMEPDGRFPTAKNPNPEFEVGFERALVWAEREKADLIIGTDPDSDRIGVMVRDGEGKFRLLTGNQMGVLFLDYVINAEKEAGTLPKNAVALKSLVSTEMARAAAEYHGVETEDTFTGFKYIAERMKKYENGEKTVIFGFEEAIGYAFGDFVRDKDAVTASVMAVEMAAYLASRGMSLIDALEELYKKLGYYEEETVSIMMPGVDGIGKMKAVMERLRSDPPKELGGIKTTRVRDYLSGTAICGGKEEKLDMRGENVLYYELEDGGRFIVRPSGTEPKIKVYLMSKADTAEECSKRIGALKAEADALAE
ncbi:MAG: phospho-sugar mutase, partial [Oscillospiraceae bacterium]|nr:phospho-sugar mutase [Oscillospiraceae bacterium]